VQKKAAELVKRHAALHRILAITHHKDDLAVLRAHTDGVAQTFVR